jgi:hypothetical protein
MVTKHTAKETFMRRAKKMTAYGNFSKLEREFIKLYSVEELKALKAKEPEELKTLVSVTSANIFRAKKELEANSEYQKAQEIMKPLKEGFREAVKWQDTKRRVALASLQKLGYVDMGEETSDDED